MEIFNRFYLILCVLALIYGGTNALAEYQNIQANNSIEDIPPKPWLEHSENEYDRQYAKGVQAPPKQPRFNLNMLASLTFPFLFLVIVRHSLEWAIKGKTSFSIYKPRSTLKEPK